MTDPAAPLGRSPLRLFALSLLVLTAALLFALFGVSLEAQVTAVGQLTSADAVELRATRAGLVEPCVRAGDDIPAGQTVLTLDGSPLAAPTRRPRWLVATIPATAGQLVTPGSLLAHLVPLDPTTGQLAAPVVRLAVPERHFGKLAVGQEARLSSPMFDARLHGTARSTLTRLEPAGEPSRDGVQFFAWADVTHAPFPLKPGMTLTAEIVLGRQPTWRVIVEH